MHSSNNIIDTTPDKETQYQSFLLPCGLNVMLFPDESPVTYAGFMIAAGSQNDPFRFHGMAHCTEHMLFKGTKLRNAKQIIFRMEEIGADFNAFTTKEDTMVYAAFPKKHLFRALNMLSDVVINSRIPQEELTKEKGVIIEEIKSYMDAPAEAIFDEYEKLLLHGSPLAHNILGSQESVARTTRQAILNFIEQHYNPANMIFAIRGSFATNDVLDYLNHAFAKFTRSDQQLGTKPSRERFAQQQQPAKALHIKCNKIVRRKGTYQAHCILGCAAYSLYNENRFALTLLNNLLGGRGMNSRLNMRLREEAGLVYTIDATYTPFVNAGYMAIYFGADKKNVEKAYSLVHHELQKVQNIPIPDAELRMSKQQIIGQFTIQEDNRETAFLDMCKCFLYFNKYNNLQQIQTKIESINQEQLLSIAKEIFVPSQMLALTYI